MRRIDCHAACWTPFWSPAPFRFDRIAAAAVETPKLMMVPRAATWSQIPIAPTAAPTSAAGS